MYRTDWDRNDTSICFKLKTFQKQELAVKYSNKVNISRSGKNENLTVVFSRECTNEGHRHFFVDDLDIVSTFTREKRAYFR